MHENNIIVKEEIDIDDTKIKLELDADEDGSEVQLSCVEADGLMKIIEERPHMITVPVHDYKSEDELKFIASLSTLDLQQKLFEAPSYEHDTASATNTNKCKICGFICENHLALASHQINHQLNAIFCSHGCGDWSNTLEEILEHEYRSHEGGKNNLSCRICHLECHDTANLSKHMSSHFYVRRFVCSLCRRHFETRQGLQLHRQHSKEMCGHIEFVDNHSMLGQLVAVGKLDVNLPLELICDQYIKTEPMDIEDQQPEHQFQPNEVIIKTEPKDEPILENNTSVNSTIISVSGSNLARQLRAKLRLPAIKRPFKAEPLATLTDPNMQSVPTGQRKPIQIPNSVTIVKRPNILKPQKVDNQTGNNLIKNMMELPQNNASSILKDLPGNCMLIKLPANTKIVKIPPKPTSVNNTTTTTNNNTKRGKIITLPSSISISTLPSSITISAQPTSPNPISALAASKLNGLPLSPQNVPTGSVNRNAYFNALSLFESLPESRKIITEFQNQIRSIEQNLTLPGSVLQTQKQGNSCLLPTQLEILRLLPIRDGYEKVRELRNKYLDYRFHWECPKCPHGYEQFVAYCTHVTTTHGIPPTEFESMEVSVRATRKISSLLPDVPSEIDSEPVPITATNSELSAASVPSTLEQVPDIKVPDVSASVVPVVPVPPVVAPAILAAAVTAPAASAATVPATKGTTKSSNITSAGRPAQYQCDECSKSFTTLGAVRIHKMIHTGELPHKCNYCDKRFRTPGQVRVHQRRHTGEKPFKCKVCALDFTHRETLISHLSRHIGMKRYKCYGCDKYFVVVSGLRAHRRLRPDTCGKVKFTARAHGPRVRVIRGEVVFESHPEHNGYLRSEDPLNILSEIHQATNEPEDGSANDI